MLRAVLLGVPPVLEQIRRDLGISNGLAGLIASLPLLMFSLSAVPGAAVATRLGAHRTVAIGLVLLTIGSAVRALPAGLFAVLGGTVILAVGIGITQPPLTQMVRFWFPRNVQAAATVVTLGLLSGGVVGAAMTPLIVHWIAHSWQGSFLFWSIPAALAAVIWVSLSSRADGGRLEAPRIRIHALLGDARVRWLAMMFIGQSVVFYTSNTWTANAAAGGANTEAAAIDLLCLNLPAVPIAIVLAATRRPFTSSPPYYWTAGLLCSVACVGWIAVGPAFGPVWSVLLGAGSTLVFVGTNAFAPSSFDSAEVAAVVATVWTAGYLCTFFGPPLGGVAIDVFHNSRAPFALSLAMSLLLLVGAARLPHLRHTA
jgi:CP family cyanate transporter-like MFS transporter